jgi:hypothetical protein
LDYHNHFLWLTDLPQGRAKIENSGWSGVEILPIQTDGKADIGGRFSAPHTTIFLLPLLLLLNKNLYQLKTLWSRYVQLRKSLLFRPVGKAQDLAEKATQYFAIVLEKDLSTLETWTTQLFQESLGSKMDGFNPKTLVNPGRLSDGFEPIEFQVDSSELMLRMMLSMHILELFVAVFAYHKGINFVDQPEVDIYKSKMKEVSVEDIPKTEKGTTEELIEIIGKTLQLDTAKRFLEVVCYWQLEEDEKDHFNQLLRAAFPERNILVFAGSDWNHHSYQAASRNEDTLFIILTKNSYEDEVEGISNYTLQRNIRILRTIAFVTHLTLKQKSRFFELLSNNSDALLRASF